MSKKKSLLAIICVCFFILNTLSFAAGGGAEPVYEESRNEPVEFKKIAVDQSHVESLLNSGAIVPGKMVIKFKDSRVRLQDHSIQSLNMVQSVENVDNWGVAAVNVGKDANLFTTMAVLNNHPDIEYVEPLYIYKTAGGEAGQTATVAEAVYEPDDTYYQKKWQWGLQAINMDDTWNRVTIEQRSDVTIAVLDTGVDTDHPDLADNLVGGYDFVNDNANPDDDNGHGTHVAGIAAAIPYNGDGIAGVAGGAKIMPVKVLNNEGAGDSLGVYLGMVYAVNHGADVINLSLGSNTPSLLIQEAVEYALAKDVVVVAATGNDDPDVNYPAAFNGVIGVGAVDYYQDEFILADFSNTGEEVDLAAPGVDIISTVPYELDIYGSLQDGYTFKNGTSMAAPFVAGMAALLRAEDNTLTVEQIQQTLEENAVDIGDGGRDNEFGAGIINGSDNTEIPSVIEFPRIVLTGDETSSGTLNLSIEVQKGKGIIDENFSGEMKIRISQYTSDPFEGFLYKKKPNTMQSLDPFHVTGLEPKNGIEVEVENGFYTAEHDIEDSGYYLISLDPEEELDDYAFSQNHFNSVVLKEDTGISGEINLDPARDQDIKLRIIALSEYLVFDDTLILPAEDAVVPYDLDLPRDNHYKVYYELISDNDIYYNHGFYNESGTTINPNDCTYIDLSNGGQKTGIHLFIGSPEKQEDDVGDTPEEALPINLSKDLDPEFVYYGTFELDYEGDRDYYKLEVINEGDYYFFTDSLLTMRGCLYDSNKNLLESRPLGIIVRHFDEGTYYLKIEGETGVELGEYDLCFGRIGTDKTISFTDEVLENVIRDIIEKPSGNILESDVFGIYELNLNEKGITSLEGIQYLEELCALQCEDNDISDVTPLMDLENLQVLDLSGNNISALSPIANLMSLVELDVSYNRISNVPSLMMPELTHLDLSHNQTTKIHAMTLDCLETFFLQGNQITDIKNLGSLSGLKVLYLDGNPVSDYSPLKTCYKNLTDKDFSAPPSAENVKISGKKTVGSTLTGAYTYTNLNEYRESGTTYRWLRSSTKSGPYTAIACAVGKTYKLTDSDLDKYIRFEVTPGAEGEPSVGLPSVSLPFGLVTKSGSGGGGGGGGTPSGGDGQPQATPTPTPTVTPSLAPVCVSVIETDPNGDKKLIIDIPGMDLSGSKPPVIDAFSTESVDTIEMNISTNIFKDSTEQKKAFFITSDQVGFEIQPGTIDVPEDAEMVTLTAKQLSLSDLPDELKNRPDESVDTSFVFDFDLNIDGNSVTEFDEPITITIKLDLSKLSNLDKVGVYYYSEHEGEWKFVGGKVNDDGTITFSTTHFSHFLAMQHNRTFGDISGHWAKEDIEVMAARHVTDGTGKNQFSPDAKISRAEFTAMIVRALDIREEAPGNPFRDVKDGDWFAETAFRANAAGLIEGNAKGNFAPANLITREEMAVIAIRAYSYYTGINTEGIITTQEVRFSDMKTAGNWAKNSITHADALGIMGGFNDRTFRPKNFTSRAEAIVVIKRLMKLVEIF